MLAALLLAEQGRRVCLVEREASAGGLLRSFDYGEHGRFDCGMHNMYETGVEALDELLFKLLPRTAWQLLEGNRRDLAGLYYRGRLQRNSLYMDLRSLPEKEWESCVGGLFATARGAAGAPRTAYDHAASELGKPITDIAIAPSAQKLFRRNAGELDPMALALTSMNRVILFDERATIDLIQSEFIRARVGFPEQRNLPPRWASGKRGYYPAEYGMYRIIDALVRRLTDAGVEMLTNHQVKRLVRDGARIRSIELAAGSSARRIDDPGVVVWTTGLPPLATLLDVPMPQGFDAPLRTVVVNMLIDRPLDIGDLYYFYCYDGEFDTFRVTNYAGYCAGAARNGLIPICVELLTADRASGPAEFEQQARRELESFGVLAPGSTIRFARAEILSYGFPMPTVRNIRALDEMRSAIRGLRLENLLSVGILSESGIFFQRDVLAHTFNALPKKG